MTPPEGSRGDRIPAGGHAHSRHAATSSRCWSRLSRHGMWTAPGAISARGRGISAVIPPKYPRGEPGACGPWAQLVHHLAQQGCCGIAARGSGSTERGGGSHAVVRGDGVQRRRRPVSQLADELARRPVQGSAGFRQVLAEVGDGVRSAAEGDLRTLIKRERIPDPMYNPRLYAGGSFIAEPDAWWTDAGWPGRSSPANGTCRLRTGSARWPVTRG